MIHLDQRWRQILDRSPDALAVHDAACGASWSFHRLAQAANAAPFSDSIAFPRGHGIPFLIEVLRAWKAGVPVCPLEPGQPVPEFPSPPPGIAHLKLTSGTTGRPRLITFTPDQLAADADHIVNTMGLHPDQAHLGVISLAHSYGFSNLVTPLLLHGIPLILASSPLPAALALAAQPWGPLALPAVPALWQAWLDAGPLPANIRLAISAGAPLPLPLEHRAFDQHQIKIHNFLGASECGGIAFDTTSIPRSDPACVGSPLHQVSVSTQSNGCLSVRSPAVGTSYWPEPDPRLHQGVYSSSDLARILPNGNLLITGRASDLINVAGRKVSPESIEAALATHPAIRDCMALGIPEEGGRGECVGMIYTLHRAVPETDLRTHLAQRLPSWQIPRHWWHRDDLTVDTRGKRSRNDWRQRLQIRR